MTLRKNKTNKAQIDYRLPLVMAMCFGIAISARAQVSPEEHLSHHPGAGGPPAIAGNGPGVGGPGMATNAPGMGGMMAGGMGEMMSGMMEQMGAPKPTDLYPSLMNLPDLPPEKRAEVQQQAQQRMQSGTLLMGQGLDQLSQAVSAENFPEMQEAMALLREGVSRFDSGLAAKRALAEGKAPRNVALQWFKREMNLLPPVATTTDNIFGGPMFHLTVIAILGTFAFAMIWMYFFKMRRASALLHSLAGGGSVTATPSATGPKATPATSALPVANRIEVASKPVEPPAFPAMKSRTEPVQKWSGQLRVCRIFEETPGVKTFRLAAQQDVALPFTYYPGQFVTLSLNIDGKSVKRSYTIASTPTQLHYCALTIKREDEGLVSRYLNDQVKEGDLLDVSGPNGKFTFTGDESDSIVLIGGGVGITPLMSVVRYLTDIGWRGDIFLLYSCRTPLDFIFREELEQLQERHPNLHVFATMTRAKSTVWMGLKGRFSAEIIGHLVRDIAKRRVHVCGPGTLMSATLDMLKILKVPEAQIHTEAFGPAKKTAAEKVTSVSSTDETTEVATSIVAFKGSGKTAPLPPDQTVLDAAEAIGVEIDNSCRSGQCGLCKVKLLSGNVTMECDDSLSDEDKQQGLILACQAKANDNIEIDA